MRILGIDPGSKIAGFAVLEVPDAKAYHPRHFRLVDAGSLKADYSLPHAERIGFMHDTLFELIKEWAPDVCVAEKAFAGVNFQTAIRLGEARGALITAVRRHSIPIQEITPTAVKKTIAGTGHASKEQIALALKMLINFDRGHLPFDVSDAVAIALAYGLSLSPIKAPPVPQNDQRTL